jgi:hypothetical protein
LLPGTVTVDSERCPPCSRVDPGGHAVQGYIHKGRLFHGTFEQIMPSDNNYWFRAKRYGWGWGLPTCWQGWAIYAVYFVLLALLVVVFRADHQPVAFVSLVAILSLVLLVVCWIKGEPPRWRWGDD